MSERRAARRVGYSMSTFDNEKFDTMPYPYDFSSRGVCAFELIAMLINELYNFFEIQDLRFFDPVA